jgi:hypothetical protein
MLVKNQRTRTPRMIMMRTENLKRKRKKPKMTQRKRSTKARHNRQLL